jgi:peroxiredoxin
MLVVFLVGSGWTLVSRLPASATTDGAPPPSPREGFSAPDFTLDTLEGGQVTLSELRGKVVMVNFWASWCPPCRAEMPAIEKVYRAYRDLGLEVLAVNTTNQDSEADAAAFVREFGLTFPIPLDRTGAVSAAYNLRGLPSTYFIGADGVIQSVVVGGPMSEALVQSKVEDLLKERR